MKRLFLILLALCLSPPMWAVGTCVVSDATSSQNANTRIPDSGTVIVTLTCTGDASTGSFPSTTVPLTGSYPSGGVLNAYNLTGFILYQVGRTPGVTQPTANYSVTVTDTQGVALDLGLLASNGSASAAQLTAITSSTVIYPVVRSALTVAITGNSVNSANITLTLIFRVSGPSGAASGAAPGGTAGGDLSGTYPNPTVAKLNGIAASSYRRMICKLTSPISNTGNTGTNTYLAGSACRIPAGTLGTNGVVLITANFYRSSGSGNCNSTLWLATSSGTLTTFIISDPSVVNFGNVETATIVNVNSASSQTTVAESTRNGGVVAQVTPSSINTASTDLYINASESNTVSGDNCTLASEIVEILP